jgi:hypothetical protein
MRRQHGLSDEELAAFLATCPEELCDLVLVVRDLVFKTAPRVMEAVKFHSLCYYRPGMPYGSIGGNVCMISVRRGAVYLAFLHGASLPDPQGLLSGRAKAKREMRITTRAAVCQPSVRRLIRAALAYSPIRQGCER